MKTMKTTKTTKSNQTLVVGRGIFKRKFDNLKKKSNPKF